jgi:hypothetical protein
VFGDPLIGVSKVCQCQWQGQGATLVYDISPKWGYAAVEGEQFVCWTTVACGNEPAALFNPWRASRMACMAWHGRNVT